MLTLEPKEWISGTIIDFFMLLLQEKFQDVCLFNEYFVDKLMPRRDVRPSGPQSVKTVNLLQEDSAPATKRTKTSGSTSKSSYNAFKPAHDKDAYKYSNVQRWSRESLVFYKRVVFWPINKQNQHWIASALVAPDTAGATHTLLHLDSFAGQGDMYLHVMEKYLNDEWQVHKPHAHHPCIASYSTHKRAR